MSARQCRDAMLTGEAVAPLVLVAVVAAQTNATPSGRSARSTPVGVHGLDRARSHLGELGAGRLIHSCGPVSAASAAAWATPSTASACHASPCAIRSIAERARRRTRRATRPSRRSSRSCGGRACARAAPGASRARHARARPTRRPAYASSESSSARCQREPRQSRRGHPDETHSRSGSPACSRLRASVWSIAAANSSQSGGPVMRPVAVHVPPAAATACGKKNAGAWLTARAPKPGRRGRAPACRRR